ncbi:MAG: DUF433 domain-containing protein [Gemmatimonadetes bacterium]|nr:DUF433 domain-containing protein [Gemmatimonadota bacterium]
MTGNFHPSELIVIAPALRSGKPCLRGTRIALADVRGYPAGGMSESEGGLVNVRLRQLPCSAPLPSGVTSNCPRPPRSSPCAFAPQPCRCWGTGASRSMGVGLSGDRSAMAPSPS